MTVHLCRPCLRGRHDRCTGLRCTCEATERCKANAELTREREVKVDA